MLEVRKIAETENMTALRKVFTCSSCGKPSFEDADMKRITFNASASSTCLCSECAKNLEFMLGLVR